MASTTRVQQTFAFGDDDGSIAAHSLDTQDANRTAQLTGTANKFLLRVLVEETANKLDQVAAGLQYSYDGGAYTDITGSSTHVRAIASSNWSDDAAITAQRLTWSGTFVNGHTDSDGADTTNVSLKAQQTEFLFCIYVVTAAVAHGKNIDFRVYDAGSALDSYTVTPRITVKKPVNLNVGALSASGQALSIIGGTKVVSLNVGSLSANGQQASIIIPTEISFTNLGSSANPDINDSTDATSFSNTSWSPPTTGAIIVFVHSRDQNSTTRTPTISGNSLTWVQIGSTYASSGDGGGMSMFVAKAAGATTGATTIDFAGNIQVHCSASFFHVDGIYLVGGVASSIVQNVQNNGSTGSEATVTLSAAGDVTNRPIAFVWHEAEESVTPRANWTEIDELTGVGQARGINTQYRDDAFETTASGSWATSAVNWAIFAAEIKAKKSIKVNLNAGSLSASGQTATVDAGAGGVQVGLNAGSLSATGQALNVVPGLAVISLQPGSLVGSGQTLTVVPGLASISLAAGSMSLAGQTATITSHIKISLAFGSISGSGQTLTVVPGAVSIGLQIGALSAAGQAATINVGATVISLQVGSLTGSGQTLQVIPGLASISLAAGSLSANGQSLQVIPGLASISLAAGSISANGQTLQVLAHQVISLQVGSLTAAGQTLDVVPGAASVSLSVGSLAANGQTLVVVTGQTLVQLGLGSLSAAGQSLQVIPGPVSLSMAAGSLAANGQTLQVITFTSISLQPGSLSVSGQTLQVIPGQVAISLAIGSISAAGLQAIINLAGAPVSIPLGAGSLSANGQALQVVPGAVSISLGAGSLAAAGQNLSIIPGAVTITLSVGSISADGQSLQIVSLILSTFANVAFVHYRERRAFVKYREKRAYQENKEKRQK